MSETTQLAKIKAPTIGEVNYAANMEKVFDNINENFKKIVSIPFLQGIKGDSFKLIERKIFDDNKNLTDEGKVLLKSIYPDKFTENKNYKALGINSSDFIGDSAINSNELLFYAIINDADEVEEKMLGQYYYFIDPEIKKLGEWYSKANATALSSFKDRSGFYMYNASTNLYTKTQFLPNLYYDNTKNDICWKFNEVETGISAIGIQGIPGENGTLQYVRVERIEGNKTSSKVNGVFNYNKTNVTFEWSNDLSDLSDGNALIFAEYKEKTNSPIINKIIFGKITKINNGFTAFWSADMIIDDRLRNDEIDAYFFNMRPGNNPVDAPKWLAIPSNADISSEEKNYGHVLYIDEPRKLNLQHSTNALDYTAADKPKPINGNSILNIKNYTVKVGNGNNDLTLAPSKINLNQTTIDGTTGIKSNSGTISHIKSDNIESGAGTITTFESTKGTITNLKSDDTNIIKALNLANGAKIYLRGLNDVTNTQISTTNENNTIKTTIAVDPTNSANNAKLNLIVKGTELMTNGEYNAGIVIDNAPKHVAIGPELKAKCNYKVGGGCGSTGIDINNATVFNASGTETYIKNNESMICTESSSFGGHTYLIGDVSVNSPYGINKFMAKHTEEQKDNSNLTTAMKQQISNKLKNGTLSLYGNTNFHGAIFGLTGYYDWAKGEELAYESNIFKKSQYETHSLDVCAPATIIYLSADDQHIGLKFRADAYNGDDIVLVFTYRCKLALHTRKSYTEDEVVWTTDKPGSTIFMLHIRKDKFIENGIEYRDVGYHNYKVFM